MSGEGVESRSDVVACIQLIFYFHKKNPLCLGFLLFHF